MSSLNAEIRQVVDEFVERLSSLVQKAAIESAVRALQGSTAIQSSVRTRAKSPEQGQRARRSAKEIKNVQSKVVAYVEAHPGARAEDIKNGLGITATETGDALKRLVASKTLKRKGERRASTYTKS